MPGLGMAMAGGGMALGEVAGSAAAAGTAWPRRSFECHRAGPVRGGRATTRHAARLQARRSRRGPPRRRPGRSRAIGAAPRPARPGRPAGPGLDPVALALERVGRQRHPAAALAAVEAGPVDLHAGEPEPAQGGEQDGRRSSGCRAPGSWQRGRGRRGPRPLRPELLPGQAAESPGRAPPPAAPGRARAAARRRRRRSARCRAGGAPSRPGRSPRAAVIQVPVTFERKGMRGGAQRDRAQPARRSARQRPAPSSREWKACEVCSRRQRRRPAPASRASQRRRPPRRARRPRRRAGALTAARRQLGGRAAARTSASRQRHGEHGAGRQLLRSAGRARPPAPARPPASSTPARQAATYSPRLWPSIACGPHPPAHPQPGQRVLDDEQRRLGEAGLGERSARSAARGPAARAGRRLRPPRPSAAGKSSSRRSSPRCGRSSSAQRSTSPRKTGSLVVEAARHARVLRPLAREQEGDRRRSPARRAAVAAARDRALAQRRAASSPRRGRPRARRWSKRRRPTCSV